MVDISAGRLPIPIYFQMKVGVGQPFFPPRLSDVLVTDILPFCPIHPGIVKILLNDAY
jgi:hypothetical protein